MNNDSKIKVINENGKPFEFGSIPDLWHIAHALKAAIEKQNGIARIVEPAQ